MSIRGRFGTGRRSTRWFLVRAPDSGGPGMLATGLVVAMLAFPQPLAAQDAPPALFVPGKEGAQERLAIQKAKLEVLIRLQQPYVKPQHCIGCGVCEHECPVRGKRAIRVTAENEIRQPEHAMSLGV